MQQQSQGFIGEGAEVHWGQDQLGDLGDWISLGKWYREGLLQQQQLSRCSLAPPPPRCKSHLYRATIPAAMVQRASAAPSCYRCPGAVATESGGSCGLFWARQNSHPQCQQQQQQRRQTGGRGAPSLPLSQTLPQHSQVRAAVVVVAVE